MSSDHSDFESLFNAHINLDADLDIEELIKQYNDQVDWPESLLSTSESVGQPPAPDVEPPEQIFDDSDSKDKMPLLSSTRSLETPEIGPENPTINRFFPQLGAEMNNQERVIVISNAPDAARVQPLAATLDPVLEEDVVENPVISSVPDAVQVQPLAATLDHVMETEEDDDAVEATVDDNDSDYSPSLRSSGRRTRRSTKRQASASVTMPKGKKKSKKLYEVTTPFDDPDKERNRLNAINARNNRVKKKAEQQKQDNIIKTLKVKVKACEKEIYRLHQLLIEHNIPFDKKAN